MLTCSYIVFVYCFVLLGVDINFETVTLSFDFFSNKHYPNLRLVERKIKLFPCSIVSEFADA